MKSIFLTGCFLGMALNFGLKLRISSMNLNIPKIKCFLNNYFTRIPFRGETGYDSYVLLLFLLFSPKRNSRDERLKYLLPKNCNHSLLMLQAHSI